MSNLINLKINNKDNIYDDIYNDAEIFLENAFNLLNGTPNEKENKKAFLYILLFDIIKINLNEKVDKFDVNNIYDSCCSLIDDNIDELDDKLSNKNNLSNVRKIFRRKKEDILKKINECNTNLKLLKKTYLNKNIENYIGNTYSDFINFNNVTVIHSNNKEYNYLLGEFFSRYLFNYVRYTNKTLSPSSTSLSLNDFGQETFYDEPKLDTFYNNSLPPAFEEDFNEIDNNFKYWIIHFFLILQIFAEKTSFNKLFKEKNFRTFIEEIRKINVKSKNKNGKKNKGKQQKGGKNSNKRVNELIKKKQGKQVPNKLSKNKKSTNNKTDKKSIFDDILKINVSSSSSKKSLRTLYHDNFRDKLSDYIKYFIDEDGIFPTPTNEVLIHSIHCKLPPFLDKKEEDLSSMTLYKGDIKKHPPVKYSQLNSELKNIKYDIYSWLRKLDFNETSNFIKELKNPLILLLFYMYYTKKTLYLYYIEALSSTFDINQNTDLNNSKNNTGNNTGNNSNNYYVDEIIYDNGKGKVSKENKKKLRT